MSEPCDGCRQLHIGLAVEIARREEGVDRIQQRIDLEKESMEKALKIATVEVNRRLDALNGEAERLKEMQATFVPRELFDSFKKWMLGLVGTLVFILLSTLLAALLTRN